VKIILTQSAAHPTATAPKKPHKFGSILALKIIMFHKSKTTGEENEKKFDAGRNFNVGFCFVRFG
jgi:hypothetical protein